MSYKTIAAITQNGVLYQRLTAAAAQEGKNPANPGSWVSEHIWELAASPGWSEAWESAVAGGVTDPGANEAVITDGMILAAVQPIDPPIQLPPQIIALQPDSASITDADFEGHIRGLNFTEDSVIIWNGAEEPTRFIDSTDIWTTVVPSVVTAPTVLDVYVRNADGQVSGIVPFTWNA